MARLTSGQGRRAACIGALALLTWQAQGADPAPASKAAPVSVRAGVHDGYTRIVYALPEGVAYSSVQLGNLLVLHFTGGGQIPDLKSVPAGLLSIKGGQQAAALGLPQGSKAHVWQLDQRVIVDIQAPPGPPAVAKVPDQKASPALPAGKPPVSKPDADTHK